MERKVCCEGFRFIKVKRLKDVLGLLKHRKKNKKNLKRCILYERQGKEREDGGTNIFKRKLGHEVKTRKEFWPRKGGVANNYITRGGRRGWGMRTQLQFTGGKAQKEKKSKHGDTTMQSRSA